MKSKTRYYIYFLTSGYGDTDPRYRGREPDREEPEEPGMLSERWGGGGGGEVDCKKEGKTQCGDIFWVGNIFTILKSDFS